MSTHRRLRDVLYDFNSGCLAVATQTKECELKRFPASLIILTRREVVP